MFSGYELSLFLQIFFKKGVHTHRVAFCLFFSSRSRPSDRGGGGSRGSHLDPEIRGGLQKNFFQPFGPQFGLKIRGATGSLGPSSRSATVLATI